jgi:uncharacterized protein YdeI (YjbR/CyaY-like superfamily)
MTITETLHVHLRTDWRDWLHANHTTAREIWLVSYRVATGKPNLPYNDAVEEALCFGWIDSTRKALDSERYAQRYSPRRNGSEYSQPNRERLARMRAMGFLHPSVEESTMHIRPEDFVVPADIRDALATSGGALAFFETTSPSYQRIRAAYVDSARSEPEVFRKRLASLIRQCERGKQFGVGIETYF